MTSSLYTASTTTFGGYRDVQPKDLSPLPRSVRIIDVREPSEFTGELGHIPGAELVPLATLPAQAPGWPRDQEILVVCRSGGRSALGAGQLHKLGFTHVMNLAGGMMAYGATGLPVER